MNRRRLPSKTRILVLAIGFLAMLSSGPSVVAQSQAKLSEKQATEIGAAVYIYGYPLITMEMTRRLTTNTAEPAGLRAPMGQFAHARTFPPVTYRDIPGANADTPAPLAWQVNRFAKAAGKAMRRGPRLALEAVRRGSPRQ